LVFLVVFLDWWLVDGDRAENLIFGGVFWAVQKVFLAFLIVFDIICYIMKQKSRVWIVAAVAATCLLVGGYGYGRQVWAKMQVLGVQADAERLVRVMKIVRNNSLLAPIILPRENVMTTAEGDYVLTVKEGVVEKTAVTSEPWREPYEKITEGLEDQDLVVLDSEVVIGQVIGDYIVINPEAGKSGSVN
jgi:hypothetical protein